MKHVGHEIYKVYKSKKLNAEELAEKVGMKRRNLYKIFDKNSIEVELLYKFSNVMEHDFFELYLSSTNKKALKKSNTQNE